MADSTSADADDGAQTNGVLKALAHEGRREVLLAIRENSQPLSPRLLAEELDQPLANVSYHVRVLAECKVVRLTKTKAVRGSLAHFYKGTKLIDDPLVVAVLGPRRTKGSDGPPAEGGDTGTDAPTSVDGNQSS
jgi:DNA-binding transcriptional ArsR family regulator